MDTGPRETDLIGALVVEDDPDYCMYLAETVGQTALARVVAVAHSGAECLEALNGCPGIDVVLLDVVMPGMDGLETARRILERHHPPAIVFVTASESYAVEAFELEAIDYLVKSPDHPAFSARMRRMLERVAERRSAPGGGMAELLRRVDGISHRLDRDSPRTAPGLLPVKDYDQGSIVLVPTDDITHVDRHGRQVLIHTLERRYRSTQSIERLAGRLEPEGFAALSPGALVNLKHIEHLIPNGDGSYDVQLADPERTVLPASRNRSRELLRRFGM